MKRYLLPFVLVSLMLTSSRCEKQKSDDTNQTEQTTEEVVEIEETSSDEWNDNKKWVQKEAPINFVELVGEEGKKLNFEITFSGFNGCTVLDKVEEVWEDGAVTLRVIAKYPQEAACTMNVPTIKANYSVIAKKTGKLTVKYMSHEVMESFKVDVK